MSQLSIGIEIRKSDLMRDIASVRTILKNADRDIVSGTRSRVANENKLFDQAYKQLEAKKAAHAKRLGIIDRKGVADAAASVRRQAAVKLAADKQILQIQARNAAMATASERRQTALRDRIASQTHRAEMRRIALQARALDQATRESAKGRRMAQRVGGERASRVMGVLGGTAGTVGTGLRMAGGIVGLGGAALVGTAVSQQLNVQKEVAALSNQAAISEAIGGGGRSREEIQSSVMGQIGALSEKTATPREDLVRGMRAFQEVAGDLKGAQAAIGGFADISDATSTDLGDLGRTAGLFSQQLAANGLKGKALEEGLDKVLRSAVALSAIGSIEMKDVAKTSGRIAAASGRAGGDPVQAIVDTLALQQMAIMGGSASGEDASTAALRFTDDIIKNEKKFKRVLGMDVRGKDKNLKPLRELALEIVDKSKGDSGKLTSLFGQEGIKVIEKLAKVRRGDMSGLNGEQSASAQAFLKGEISKEEVAKGAAFARSQEGRQFSSTMDGILRKLGEDLTPAIKEIADTFRENAPAIRDFGSTLAGVIKWLIENPWKGVGAAVAAALTNQIASVAVSIALTRGLTALLAPAAVSGVAGVAGSALGTAGAGAAAGGVAAKLGTAAAGVTLGLGASIVAAVGAVAAAGYQWYQLGKELDGESLIDTMNGKVNARKDEEARQRRRAQDAKDQWEGFSTVNPFGQNMNMSYFDPARTPMSYDYMFPKTETFAPSNPFGAKQAESPMSLKDGPESKAADKLEEFVTALTGATTALKGIGGAVPGVSPVPNSGGRTGAPMSRRSGYVY